MHPSNSAKKRIFICSLAKFSARQAIEQLRRDVRWPADLWWTEPDRLHMTVMKPVYLYDDQIVRLRAAVRRTRFDRFSMTLHQFHANGTRALLHACTHPAFTALRCDMDDAALRAGIVPGDPPNPHVTLSTNVHGWTIPSMRTAVEWPVDEVCLVWSQLKKEVGRRQYVVLERCAAASTDWRPAQRAFTF